jgi:hypothetical protein
MDRLPVKDVWRSVSMVSGEQSVMISGELLMLKWHVLNLDTHGQVRENLLEYERSCEVNFFTQEPRPFPSLSLVRELDQSTSTMCSVQGLRIDCSHADILPLTTVCMQRMQE